MNITLFYITAFLYALSTFVYIVHLITHRRTALKWGKHLLTSGFVFHILTVIVRFFEAGYTPLTNLYESLSFFALLLVLLFLIFEERYKIEVLGSFVAPLSLLLITTASFLPKEIGPIPPALQGVLLPIHVAFALLGNAFFALAACVSLMYLIQEHYIKKRKLGSLYFILPSLEVLDELNRRCLIYGFPLLTIGIITGSIWAEAVWGAYWSWDPRQIGSLITWLLYAILLHGRLTVGWRGRKAALYAIGAFTILISSYLIVNLLSLGAHVFY